MATILRVKDVCKQSGYKSPTSLRMCVKDGTFTNPIPIGLRSIGWPDFEVDAIVKARIAGQSDGELRKLVNRLHGERKLLAQA